MCIAKSALGFACDSRHHIEGRDGPLGDFRALAVLHRGMLSIRLWAERPIAGVQLSKEC